MFYFTFMSFFQLETVHKKNVNALHSCNVIQVNGCHPSTWIPLHKCNVLTSFKCIATILCREVHIVLKFHTEYWKLKDHTTTCTNCTNCTHCTACILTGPMEAVTWLENRKTCRQSPVERLQHWAALLHWTTRHLTLLHCNTLHCTVPHCTALHCTTLHFTVL